VNILKVSEINTCNSVSFGTFFKATPTIQTINSLQFPKFVFITTFTRHYAKVKVTLG